MTLRARAGQGDLQARLKQLVAQQPVMLFMKASGVCVSGGAALASTLRMGDDTTGTHNS